MSLNIPAFKTAIRLLREWDTKLAEGTSDKRLDMKAYFRECGTACCAFGYLTVQPEIQAFGVRFDPRYNQFNLNEEEIGGDEAVVHIFTPGNSLLGDDLFDQCFAVWLPVSTPGEVADRMEQFMKEHSDAS